MHKGRLGARHLPRDCSNWGGRSAATSGSIIAGVGGDAEGFRKYAAELVALGPGIILGTAASIVTALQQVSRTIPIVFVSTIDPVGAGLVASLARPGGNATGFTSYEFSLSAKLLELLKEIAPSVTRVAVIRDAAVAAGLAGFAAIQAAAPSFGVELSPVRVRGPAGHDG